MWDFLGPIVRVFVLVWFEDERPGARWFAVGCLVIALAAMGICGLIYAS